jgi:hypothetical protein
LAQDTKQIKVLSEGDLFIAPVGTALPETVDEALDPAFINLGLVTDDGVTFSRGQEVEDIMSWQRQTPSRRIVTGRTFTAAAQLQQHNPDNFALAFGGGEWSEPDAGIYRYDPPADGDALAEYAVVIDAQDGDRHDRAVILRSTVEGEVETQFVRNAASVLPITFSALTPDDADRPWYYLSDDEAFAGAGS